MHDHDDPTVYSDLVSISIRYLRGVIQSLQAAG
jgi:hypothetical protein